MIAALIVLTALAGAAFVKRKPALRAERVGEPAPTAMAQSYDREVETREITLPETTWFTIQTGVFSAREAAEDKAEELADRGAPGVVVQDGAKWRVFIASYGKEGDATTVRQRLGEMQRVETYLYPWCCGELSLRLTGMVGQLDLLIAGMQLFMESAVQLRDTAMLIDAAQLSGDEALQVVKDVDDGIRLWSRTAQECFGRQRPEIVILLMQLADNWQGKYQQIRNAAATVTGLSAALKQQGMRLYDEVIRFRKEVESQ